MSTKEIQERHDRDTHKDALDAFDAWRIHEDRGELLKQLEGMECYRVWSFGHDEACNLQTDDVVAWGVSRETVCPVCRIKAALEDKP